MSKSDKWIVRLGRAEWLRFTYPRDGDEFELIGSVRHGAAIGALAVTADGRYLQVNGDHVSGLNTHELRRAVQAAELQAPRSTVAAVPAPAGSSRTPVVVVKRRKVLAPAGA